MTTVGFIRANIEEIARDPALRIYGAMLGLLHVLSYLHWERVQPLAKILDPSIGPAICWPFFESCGHWRLLSEAGVERLLLAYYLFAVATMVLFAKRKLVPVAWGALIGLTLFKSLILFQDYRLRLNQHYMTYWMTLAFLFIPNKRRAIPFLIASFYFWAGTLKFNSGWISGAALYGKKPLGVPEFLIPASCVYVIFLELIVAFGLLVRNRWIFWCSMAQFVAFHITSWPIVQFFYPTLMLAILSIFPLARYMRDPSNPEEMPPHSVDLKRFVRGREAWGTYAIVGTFACFQMIPYIFPGDQAFTGEGRLFALHMFDAPLECKAWATVHSGTGEKLDVPLRAPFLMGRIGCDPIVYFNVAKDICNRIERDKRFGPLDVHLLTRRSGDKQYRSVIEQSDFCHSDLHYNIWRPNDWILNVPSRSSP